MKDIIIIVLVLFLAVLGYQKLVQNNSPDSTNGVNVSQSGKKEINLSGRGLKEVSQEIFDNRSATTLDVSNNSLTGSLPAEIRKLTNLTVLKASDNNMTGIPAEIGQLNKLQVADFSNNNLTGLPLEIGNMNNLQTLDLRGNPNVSKYDISQIQPKIPNAKILTD